MSLDTGSTTPALVARSPGRRPPATRRSASVEVDRRVLLVGDDEDFVHALTVNLEARGYVVDAKGSELDAPATLDAVRPDLVLLDLRDAPTALAVIRTLREHSRVPLVVVADATARDHQVVVLDAGADDFITKPFGLEEVLARLRAAVRRGRQEHRTHRHRVITAHFSLDLTNRLAETPAGVVHLTPKEWAIVDVLVAADGRVVPRRDLLEQVWGPARADRSNYLRVYLAQLRKKLEPEPSHPRYFVTDPRVGIQFDPTPPASPDPAAA